MVIQSILTAAYLLQPKTAHSQSVCCSDDKWTTNKKSIKQKSSNFVFFRDYINGRWKQKAVFEILTCMILLKIIYKKNRKTTGKRWVSYIFISPWSWKDLEAIGTPFVLMYIIYRSNLCSYVNNTVYITSQRISCFFVILMEDRLAIALYVSYISPLVWQLAKEYWTKC